MPDVRTVILLRHGEADTPAPDAFLGRTDTALTENGRLAAQNAAKRLSRMRLDAIVTSPLVRCVQTARLLRLPPEIRTEPGFAERLASVLRVHQPDCTVAQVDVSDLFLRQPPTANLATRFTPCCMLRLYADLVPDLPDRILYLDSDVIVRENLAAFYHQPMDGFELAGCLDYYGS